MKILIDMNLSHSGSAFLSRMESRLFTGPTVGEPTAPDSQILEHAASKGFVVFTHDLDFGMLLAARKARGPSVLQVRTQDVLPAAIGAPVLQAVDSARDHLEAGAIVTVDVAKHRIRLLPI